MKIRSIAARVAAVALAVPAIVAGVGLASHAGPAISNADPGGDPGGSSAGASAGVGAPSGGSGGALQNHNEIVIAD